MIISYIVFIFIRQAKANSSVGEQQLYLVEESCLLSLFDFCPMCNAECDSKVTRRIGTKIIVQQECKSCSFMKQWDSQPLIGNIPLGNIMMSSGILFGGGSPSNILKSLKHMNILTIGYSTFMDHQKKYLHTAVQKTYQKKQGSLIESTLAKRNKLILGGDGRCDSPGHSAKYGCYSLLDVEQNKIIDSQLVQVIS